MRRSPREFPLRIWREKHDTTLLFRELTYATAQFARVVPSGTKFSTGIAPTPLPGPMSINLIGLRE
jgi:hypothetical protein